ncbi:Hemolymph lipopolysaccharide-binding protein [Dufourea novaeangliae]|uniref:Hemolymph lipopolysaccharide-binding protein n=1 Tax=Dufourea novaeangliae TaxID=178035 RepID=A0A154P542_DUFNO|nr:Hemolymph lipopolysaccharide-binding protein [Dufourea novaeangliae]
MKPGIGAYKYHNRKRVWNAARKSCLDEGGQLAVLNTEQEEKFLKEWIQKENLDRIWLGIHDLFEEGEWVTLTGESLDVAGFERWSTVWPNQPDNYGGRQNCGVLIKEGGLDDVECDATISYICEITLC